MDAHGNVTTSCRRCGGSRRQAVERLTLDLDPLRITSDAG
jgi:hypothetical protein